MDFITVYNTWAKKKHNKLWRDILELFNVRKIELFKLNLLKWKPPTLPTNPYKIVFFLGDNEHLKIIHSNPLLHEGSDLKHDLKLMEAGNELQVGCLNNEIIYYAWVVFKRKSMFNKFFILRDKEFIMMRIYMRPDYRGSGIFKYALDWNLKKYREKNYKCAFIDIDSSNLPSKYGCLKIGMKNTGTYYYHFRFLFKNYAVAVGDLKKRFISKNDFNLNI